MAARKNNSSSRGAKPGVESGQRQPSKRVTQLIVVAIIVALVGGTYVYQSLTAPRTDGGKQTASLTLEDALAQGKPVYILFHSLTCEPCKEMEAVVRRVIPAFDGQITYLDVNVYDESRQDLVNQFRIETIPTSVFLDARGNTVSSFVGVMTDEQLRAYLEKLSSGETQ